MVLLAPEPGDFPPWAEKLRPASPLWTQLLPRGLRISRTTTTKRTYASGCITHQDPDLVKTQGKVYCQPCLLEEGNLAWRQDITSLRSDGDRGPSWDVTPGQALPECLIRTFLHRWDLPGHEDGQGHGAQMCTSHLGADLLLPPPSPL